MYLDGKTYESINRDVVEFLIDWGIFRFPIDPLEICRKIGIELRWYQQLDAHEQGLALTASDDAFHIREASLDLSKMVIAVNREQYSTRIRFSLAHELGHLIRNHTKESERNESEANYLAGYLLAPDPLVIEHCPSFDIQDVMHTFDIGAECAQIACKHARNRAEFGGDSKDYEIALLENCYIGEVVRLGAK